MKHLILIAISFISLNSSAVIFSCDWQQTANLPKGYFQESGFELEVHQGKGFFIQHGFFDRSYKPCWTGNFSSCSFGFGMDVDESFEVSVHGVSFFLMQRDRFNPQLKFSFLRVAGDGKFEVSLSGNDGDGVEFEDHRFLCSSRSSE